MSSAVTISVLLPVWNCPHYVGQAVESILNQSYSDFECIIIDDGSTDNTPEILRKYQDPRIRFVQHANRGLAATLNEGIELARGKYIARQDQDDISLPDRLTKQLAYVESHPECGLLGTWAQIMEGDRLTERYHKHPASPSELRYQLLFNNPFVHSSVMLRKSVVETVGGYSTDPSRQPPEDYELWSRLSRHSGVANLPEVLLYYREVPGSMSRIGPSPFREKLIKICLENLSLASGVPSTDPNLVAIAAVLHGGEGFYRPDRQRITEILHRAAASFADPRDLSSSITATVDSVIAGAFVDRTSLGRILRRPGPLRNIAKKFWRLLQVARPSP
jgi:hypothetical protein